MYQGDRDAGEEGPEESCSSPFGESGRKKTNLNLPDKRPGKVQVKKEASTKEKKSAGDCLETRETMVQWGRKEKGFNG